MSRDTIASRKKQREARIMAKEQKKSLIDRISRAVDEGATGEIDMQPKDVKLFGRLLNLTGKVKFRMEPMKRSEDRS